jgi:dTDP-4-amino-4,6-dideoxygalactose transaminase
MARRHLALLGGTTTLADCVVAMRYLAFPSDLVRGPMIRRYEQEFARTIGVRHAISFLAGRVGLYGLLRALGVGPGDEVLLQAPTHIVVANAIRFTGARPVYVDCRLDTFTMDLEQAERRITPRTRVLLLQHTFGIPVDMDAAMALARDHGLEVIEDCVHSLGATYAGKPVGSFGRAAFFSTEETKTISTTMGGMVVTDDLELAERMTRFQAGCAWPGAGLTARYLLKLLAYHALTQPSLHGTMRALYERIGQRQPLPRPTSASELRGERPPRYEQRLTNAQAAVGLRQLRRLAGNVAHRRRVSDAISGWLSQRGIDMPQPPRAAQPALVRYPLWVTDRAQAIAATSDRVVLGTWFTSVLEEATSPAAGDYTMGSCPRAETAARHLVNLPTHQRVRVDDVEELAATLDRHALLRRYSSSSVAGAGRGAGLPVRHWQ